MEKDAFLLLGAFLVALFTFNWSDIKLIVAHIKEKIAEAKAKNDPQDES